MEDFKDNATLKVVGEFPLRAIREVQEDGSDIYIGDIGISRCVYGELMDLNGVDWENASERKKINDSLELGDPSILWSIVGTYQEAWSFYLARIYERFLDAQPSSPGYHDRRSRHIASRMGHSADECAACNGCYIRWE